MADAFSPRPLIWPVQRKPKRTHPTTDSVKTLTKQRKVLLALTAAAALCLQPVQAHAYSVMTHEEVVDMAWLPHMVPLLKARFPGLTDDQLREAHAFAYGGCVIQDIGYYPKGSKFFSDLTHYVRSGDFVLALLNDATTPDELAFALGALAHYTSDEIGHPFVNIVEAQEFPRLAKKFNNQVTYEKSPTHHLRTEFGFDVVGVSRGKYAQEDYRNFIGFQVAKPLVERAFEETYGLKLKDVIGNMDSSIGSCRWAVHTLIPKMTKVALLSYHDNIEHANPGVARDKFLFRMNRTEYQKSWGKDYKKPGIGSHILAAIIHILPKVGPLKDLDLKLPNGDQQTLYIQSVNETVDKLNRRLDKMRAVATPAPMPTVAQSNGKDPDAGTVAAVAKDTQQAANNKGETQGAGAITASPNGYGLAASDVAQPVGDVPLNLTSVDLDTGKATAPGEYGLADATYADLLKKVADTPPTPDTPAVRNDLLLYFGTDHDAQNTLSSKTKDWKKVQASLVKLKAAPTAANAPATGD